MTTTIERARTRTTELFSPKERTILFNQQKVLQAFHKAKIGTHCFGESTGYAYDDIGRESLERVYAEVFRAERALVRPQIASGTHAISLCLSLVRPGEEILSLSGLPYDTLQQVIGTKGSSPMSLIKRGILYRELSLTDNGELDYEGIEQAITDKTRMVMIQRSSGYTWRPAIRIDKIAKAFAIVRRISPSCLCFVDNCYGEFVEDREPVEAGAHLVAGSLIKNPGGTLAPSGGYIVGRRDLVEMCSEVLTAPGIGYKIGPTFGLVRTILQGLFQAPHVVGEALFGALLTAEVFSSLGYEVSPLPNDYRTDIIQAIKFHSQDKLMAFCKGIQSSSPIDAHYTPIPAPMPGYEDQVIMAGGTFVQGSSIELSADAPLREPFIGFLQGGFSRQHVEIALNQVLVELAKIH